MNRYISLLRGINVSGHNKIKMVDLKTLYEEIGCKNVVTYIQSGNVVFDHTSIDISDIKQTLEDEIANTYPFSVYVDVIGIQEFENAKKNMPFQDIDPVEDGSKTFLAFLSDVPSKQNIDALMQYVSPPDRMSINEKTLYFHLPEGAGKSKLSTNFIESKLKLKATARNLRTVIKLCDLGKE